MIIVNGTYPGPSHDNLVPCSDAAGEIVAVGEDVNKWAVGDRVCANFTLAHLHGDLTPDMMATSLGGSIDGVLTEYRTFPAEVSGLIWPFRAE